MGLITFFGKSLIVASLIFQAFLLYSDKAAIAGFDRQLAHGLAGCDCVPADIQAHIKEHLRLVVVGLLASSALMLALRCWCLKLLTLLGLGLLLWVEHHESFRRVPSLALLENTALWHSLGLVGVVVYLLGAECGDCKKGEGCGKKENGKNKKE